MSRLGGAIAGGLIAGGVISVMLMVGEAKSSKPSEELTELGRAARRRVGVPAEAPGTMPGAEEQIVDQGGHLALSAVAGAAYAVATDRSAGVLTSGVGFGLAFYAALHWVVGPLLGLKQPEWRSGKGRIAFHAVNHVMFGVLTAWGAKLAKRR